MTKENQNNSVCVCCNNYYEICLNYLNFVVSSGDHVNFGESCGDTLLIPLWEPVIINFETNFLSLGVCLREVLG